MANLQETLKGNPFKDIIIPVIAGLQGNRVTYEDKAAAAQLLSLRLDSWGEQMYFLTPRGRNVLTEVGVRTRLFSGNPYPNARIVNLGRRKHGLLNTLEQQLESLGMDGPNDFIYFNQIVDIFHANVDFITYFAVDYLDGKYKNYALGGVSLFEREGSSLTGLVLKTVQQGEDAGTLAEVTVTSSTVVVGDAGDYFTVYSIVGGVVRRNIFWFTVDASGSQPVVAPVGGIVDTYYQIDLLSANTAEQNTTAIGDAIDLIAGIGLAKVTFPTTTSVAITNTEVGTVPTSEFDIAVGWSVLFVDGTPGVATKEATEIDFSTALASDMSDKYFIIYDGSGNRLMFWYRLDGAGTEPIAAADFKYPVDILTSDKPAAIQSKTLAVMTVNGFDLFSTAGLVSVVVTQIKSAQPDAEGGTVAKGNVNAVSDIKGFDDSVLFTGVVLSDAEYALTWNALKVPYDRDNGVNTPYLKSVDPVGILAAGAGGAVRCVCPYAQAFAEPTPEQAAAYQEYWACIQSCESAGINNQGVFITTQEPSEISELPYNVPYNTGVTGRRRPPGR